MARKSKTAVLKRQRELKKAEKAAAKREKRAMREPTDREVATRDDLAGYGLVDEDEEAADEDGRES
jgi:hypothetical protein